METIKQFKKGNQILKIFNDSDSDSREWDNLGKMVCFYNGYSLGDKHDLKQDDFNSWDALSKHIIKEEKAVVILPIYMYNHSGITIRTTPFGCQFDSGQVGFIYTTTDKIKENFSVKKVTKKLIDKVIEMLKQEVKTYDDDLTGNVYSFSLVEIKKCECCNHSEEILKDSCCGFYGTDFKENGLFDHAEIKDISKWEEI